MESRREPRGSGSVVGQGDGGLDSGRGGSGEKWADWGCPGSEALERSRADGVLSVRSCWGASTDAASQVAAPRAGHAAASGGKTATQTPGSQSCSGLHSSSCGGWVPSPVRPAWPFPSSPAFPVL